MPVLYYSYFDVFNKYDSNILLNYRLYNYKINFDEGYRLEEFGYNPLYKISLNELEIVRKYIIKNLIKGFIKSDLLL